MGYKIDKNKSLLTSKFSSMIISTPTLALALGIAMSATAQTHEYKVTESLHQGLEKTNQVTSQANPWLKAEANRTGILDEIRNNGKIASATATPKDVPTGNWTSLGEGTWVEGLLSQYTNIDRGLTWSVEIEESDETPGYYRMYPYADASNPISANVMKGKVDEETVIYLNATDIEKPYIEGQFTPFGMRIYMHFVAENKAQGGDYATYKDGIFSFPANSFAYMTPQGDGWYYANRDGDFKIALPGAVVRDYTFSATASWCANEYALLSFERGEDVADIKYMLLSSPEYGMTDANAKVVAQNGNSVGAGYTSLRLSTEGADPGVWTALIVALSEDGDIVGQTECHFLIPAEEDPENWQELGTGVYSESYLSGLFSDIDVVNLGVKVEQNVNEPGRYRIVNPYAEYTEVKNGNVGHEGHDHYIYINATDPVRVYVEPSVLGVQVAGFGEAFGWSWGSRYVMQGRPERGDTDEVYGTLEGDVVTVPYLILGMSNYNSGKFRQLSNDAVFKVTIPDPAGVGSIEADDANAPVEYFNLQGVRVANPENGLFIRRQGNKAEKVVIK